MEAAVSEQRIVRYLEAARPVHEDLRRAVTQISGFSMMIFTTPMRRALPDALIHETAAFAARTADMVRGLAVPAGARHHHHHLMCASGAVTQSCAAAIACLGPVVAEADRDALVDALKSAVEHLRILSRLMPGFEPVNFGQACCALHAVAVPQR